MSDPYNQYNQYNQYPPQGQYGSPAPGQGYPPPQPTYEQQQGYPTPPPQGYTPQQQQPSGASQGYYQDPYAQNQGGYGPPAQGGFQHGQAQPPAPYGQDPYQQNQSAYGQQYPGAPPSQQFPQQGAYPPNQYPHDKQPGDPYGQPPQQQYGSTDPGAQQEGDRGLMGAIGGGAAGYFGGKKMGGHTIIGTLAGAFAGSKLEDKFKKNKYGK